MANVKQLKHLEHLEDELLNHGVEGCKMIVEHFLEVKGLLGCAGSDVGYMQTKWDGAPSVVCGTDPITGIFFVGTKSVFNKRDPKPCASDRGIDELYADEKPGLAVKLKFCLKHFKPVVKEMLVCGLKNISRLSSLYPCSCLSNEIGTRNGWAG